MAIMLEDMFSRFQRDKEIQVLYHDPVRVDELSRFRQTKVAARLMLIRRRWADHIDVCMCSILEPRLVSLAMPDGSSRCP